MCPAKRIVLQGTPRYFTEKMQKINISNRCDIAKCSQSIYLFIKVIQKYNTTQHNSTIAPHYLAPTDQSYNEDSLKILGVTVKHGRLGKDLPSVSSALCRPMKCLVSLS